MALRDNAIVAYAETKVMKKSDRDVWVLMGEMLESLLDKTGFEKKRDRRAGDVRPDRHRRRQHVLGAEHRRHARPRSRLLRAGAHRRLLGGGRRGARGCRDRRRHVRGRGLSCSPTPMCASTTAATTATIAATGPTPTACWARPAPSACCSRAYDAKYGVDLPALGKLAVTQRNHAIMNENACEELRVPITDRRLPELAHDRRSDPAARLRDAGRRRRRPDHDQPARSGEGKRPQQVRHPDRLCRAHQLPRRRGPGRRDAERPRDRRQEGARAAAGWNIKDVRSFHPYDDFIIAHHDPVRGVRLLQAGRGHGVRPRHRLRPTTATCR